MLEQIFEKIHLFEMPYIEALQVIRGPYVDLFFRSMVFFDSIGFLLVLIPVVWFGFSKQSGLRIFYITLLSVWFNFFCKMVFEQPRPFHFNPHVALVSLSSSWGFPSGAAQSCFLLGTIFIRTFRNWWAWVIGVTYIAIVSFSRVFLGVHFYTDVLGGWFCAGILLLVYYRLFPWIKETYPPLSKLQKLLIAGGVAVLALVLSPTSVTVQVLLSCLGLNIGLWIAKTYHLELREPLRRWDRILGIILGIGGLFALHYSLRYIPNLQWREAITTIFPLFFGLWLSSGVPYLLTKKISWKKV